MFIAEMFTEAAGPQLVVFYPGRFQPFHLGHRDVFASLQAKFGRDNVFIATSNKVELPKSPFNFSEKTAFMNAAGVASDRILQVTSPYKLPEQFDPANTVFVAAVGAPDADRLRPGATKQDGSAGYYQVFESVDKCATADKHGYVIIAKEREFDIELNGKKVDVSHGTPSRAAWNSVRDDAQGRSQYLVQMFGRDDPELGRILDKIPVNEDVNMDQTDSISPVHGHGVYETIRKVKGGYRLVSHTGKNLGTYPNKSGAEKRERQVQYFKHVGESVTEVFNTQAAVKEDAAGVGVVSNSKDPRYVMATAGDQNDVTAETLPKMMKAYGLIGKLPKHKVQEAEQLLSKLSALQEQIRQLKSKK